MSQGAILDVEAKASDSRMNILVLTGYDDAMQELGDICLPSKRAYADRHGYAFECVRDFRDDTHPSWQKVRLITERISDHDAVLWLDADSIVTNPSVRVQDLISDQVITISADWCNTLEDPLETTIGISCGNFIVRNGMWCPSFLARWIRNTTYAARQTCCWEQSALMSLMRSDPWINKRVHRLERRKLNAVHAGCELPGLRAPDPWQPGDYLIHLTNIPDRIERAKEFAQWALKNA